VNALLEVCRSAGSRELLTLVARFHESGRIQVGIGSQFSDRGQVVELCQHGGDQKLGCEDSRAEMKNPALRGESAGSCLRAACALCLVVLREGKREFENLIADKDAQVKLLGISAALEPDGAGGFFVRPEGSFKERGSPVRQ
jgi:hypothetical protein